MSVDIQVVGIGGGDNGDVGPQMQERPVVFIGLYDTSGGRMTGRRDNRVIFAPYEIIAEVL